MNQLIDKRSIDGLPLLEHHGQWRSVEKEKTTITQSCIDREGSPAYDCWLQ